MLIFEDKSWAPEEVAAKALGLTREWKQAQQGQQTKGKKLPPYRYDQISLRQDLIECQTDAAWDKGQRKAGLAWIFTGLVNPVQDRGHTTQDFVNSPLIAEALEVRSGLCIGGNNEALKAQSLLRQLNAHSSNQQQIANEGNCGYRQRYLRNLL
ncbi:unnamed protein product [Brassica rapa]|uniref:Uncharacterized protein n=1 Tax=Brassica campestris TaxID=3711 RepID=A0A3P5ZSI6_BRACM|nr:unnamed protein product [Brassica rapa]VDC83716.1 unnamed protein product [Brassica rapa]